MHPMSLQQTAYPWHNVVVAVKRDDSDTKTNTDMGMESNCRRLHGVSLFECMGLLGAYP